MIATPIPHLGYGNLPAVHRVSVEVVAAEAEAEADLAAEAHPAAVPAAVGSSQRGQISRLSNKISDTPVPWTRANRISTPEIPQESNNSPMFAN